MWPTGAAGASVKETNLYICNLGPSASEDMLEELFGDFGTIVTRHGVFELLPSCYAYMQN